MKFNKVLHLEKGWNERGAKRIEQRRAEMDIPPQHILELRARLKFFSVEQAAALLGVSHYTLRDYIKHKKLRCQRVGRLIKISSYDLAAFLESQAA